MGLGFFGKAEAQRCGEKWGRTEGGGGTHVLHAVAVRLLTTRGYSRTEHLPAGPMANRYFFNGGAEVVCCSCPGCLGLFADERGIPLPSIKRRKKSRMGFFLDQRGGRGACKERHYREVGFSCVGFVFGVVVLSFFVNLEPKVKPTNVSI